MKIVLPIIGLLFLAGCTAIEVLAPPVDNLFVSEAKISPKEAAYLEQGRKIYISSCAQCHSAHQVDKITALQWERDVPKMYKKAELYPNEIAPLEAYMKAAARINQKLIVLRKEKK